VKELAPLDEWERSSVASEEESRRLSKCSAAHEGAAVGAIATRVAPLGFALGTFRESLPSGRPLRGPDGLIRPTALLPWTLQPIRPHTARDP
jgi:hypothetical protein